MYSTVITLASLAALARAASISCGAATNSGTLWYGNAPASAYTGQLGILEARGNAELLAKYPNSEVDEITVEIIPCNSTYLNATIGGISGTPVKLQLADGSGNCLALEATSETNDVFITKQTCQNGDDDSQVAQFWTQDTEYESLFPTWQSVEADRWTIQFNVDDTEEVYAAPPAASCSDCQDSTNYSLSVEA